MALKKCEICGFYTIHSRDCPHYERPAQEELDQEWRPPETAEELLNHFEIWVEPWAGECFDCKATIPFGAPIFAGPNTNKPVAHHPACLVVFLHAKLAKEAGA